MIQDQALWQVLDALAAYEIQQSTPNQAYLQRWTD